MQRRILEKDVEKKVCEWADELGIEHIKMELKHDVGWPDRMFLVPGGKPVIIEFKRPKTVGKDDGGTLKGIQKQRIKYLSENGYNVDVCDTKESAIRAITEGIYGGRGQTNKMGG